MNRTVTRFAVALLSLTAALPLAAQSGTAAVAGTANVFRAGGNTTGVNGDSPPVVINLSAGINRILTFSSVTGSWGCAGIAGYSADGFATDGSICVGEANVFASNSISGLHTPGHSMSLTGLFLGTSLPATAPTAYDYSAGYASSSFSGIQLGQLFFVGDGRVGNQLLGDPLSGTIQQFLVPDGATQLVLGIADACSFFGTPSCYDDNVGTMQASYSVTGTAVTTTAPEPATYLLFGAGMLAIGFASRRRRNA